MSQTLFEASWRDCWPALGATGDGLAVREALLAAYAEPQRHYHTRQHLAECLALLARYRDLADEPAEIGIALWFHDAIYDVKASDNEARSAEWAARELTAARVGSERVARVQALILATRHDAVPQEHDARLLVGIDLAILGATPERFAEYEAQIRAEYAWVPGPLFRRKRRAILRALLARSPLYGTPALQAQFEASARSNLAAAVRPRTLWQRLLQRG
ncbi:HD domain-containing protein [Chitinolyticbacter albus]|uniref:HD domain-containing protein n=1 Tax=Chitinolyticbacter albus TaxID=2961951 RepID=UPI00210CC2F1|nr:metal-dependent hydrolase [Chitinolyticbacter albus]